MEPENPYAAPTTTPYPEGEENNTEMRLAPLGTRFLGALIDGIVLGIISIPAWVAGFMVTGVRSSVGILEMLETQPLIPTIMATVIAWTVWIGINYHFWATRGQSIGKMAMGTKIVRTDGSKAEASRIIGHRFLAIGVLGLIPMVGAIIGLVDALLIFRTDRNCLHDDIADTRVILINKLVS